MLKVTGNHVSVAVLGLSWEMESLVVRGYPRSTILLEFPKNKDIF